MKRITHVKIPAKGDYSPFYNPGGPGTNPTPGVPYSAPSPTQKQKIWRALNDPHVVDFDPAP
ncbi:MAG: hypothetical protein ACRDL3_16235 [Solirubrobacterales bacterium]